MKASSFRQGQTVHLVYFDISIEEPRWAIGTYRLYSDKEPLPEMGKMIEKMPRAFFRDRVYPTVAGKNRVFYSRRKAIRKCDQMNRV